MGAKKFKNSRLNGSLLELIELIETSLLDFTSSKEFETKCKGNSLAGEDTITSALRGHLDDKNREMYNAIFKIETQTEQAKSTSGKGKKRTIDIAIATSKSEGHYIFCLEAKWINAKDYVTNNTGAIKRFKKCEHGLSSPNSINATSLPDNGIVAYVKSGEFDTHLTKINEQIKKLCETYSCKKDEYGLYWFASEKLSPIDASKEDRYISEHTRIDNSPLKLHHFWVKVS